MDVVVVGRENFIVEDVLIMVGVVLMVVMSVLVFIHSTDVLVEEILN